MVYLKKNLTVKHHVVDLKSVDIDLYHFLTQRNLKQSKTKQS